jgi:hypothetical protein
MTQEQWDRFLLKVEKTSYCWNWIGAVTSNRKGRVGYGFIMLNGKNVYAHRASFEHFSMEIPDGLVIDHTCENTLCVNPEHLEAVTNGENIHRANARVKVKCKHNHLVQRSTKGCTSCELLKTTQWYFKITGYPQTLLAKI